VEEIWKDISNYEGKYEVSNLGRVRSLSYNGTGEIKFLKQSTNKRGYKRVGLCKNGKMKNCYVHRLVAITFIPNPNNHKEVNHKDENPANNNVNNLEWCTSEYNNNYGTRNKRAGESKKGKSFSEEHKKKLSESHKGKHRSEETKKKISKSLRGENSPFYGKHLSEEHKKKMSESHKGKTLSEEHKKKISKSLKGERKGKDNPNAKPILMYDKEENFIRRFDCIGDANEYFGKDSAASNISNCLIRRSKTAYGYVFVYAEEIEKK